MNETAAIECLKEQSKCYSRKLAYTTQLFAQEEFLRRLSNSKNRNDFTFTGVYSLYGKINYPQKVSIPLEFEIRKQDNLIEYVKTRLSPIFSEENKKLNSNLISDFMSFNLDYIKEKVDCNHNEIIQVQIIGKLLRMKIPFIIKFYIVEEETLKPKDVTYKSQIQELEDTTILTSRLEVIVAQKLKEILKRKEVTDSLQEVFIIYLIASNFSVNGRRIKDQLRIYKEQKESWFCKDEFENVFKFEMEKQHQVKWKQFCNVAGEKETNFKEIIQLLVCFLSPIWDAVFSESEFFGDWMPELKRYLG